MVVIQKYQRGRCGRCTENEEPDLCLGVEVVDADEVVFLCLRHLHQKIRQACRANEPLLKEVQS